MVSHPETGSDSPIGSDQYRGRDRDPFTQVHHMSYHVSPDTRCLEKREIMYVLESKEIQWVN